MFVGPSFFDDRNLTLMWVQHDLWFKIGKSWIENDDYALSSCFYIFSMARKAIMFYTDSNPLFFPERDKLISINNFDHRVLQNAHDQIAAYYRWCNSSVKPPVFVGEMKDYQDFLHEIWVAYLRYEIAQLTFRNLQFAEMIVRAVLFENTPQGYAEEDKITIILEKRYGNLFKDERNAFLKIVGSITDDEGYIYVMASPALKKDFYKIGKTTRTPQERAEEISTGTGVPLRFYVVFQSLVSNCHVVEQIIHSKLSKHRSNISREFFELPLHEVIDVISTVARSYPPSIGSRS